jgi:hypothetical protein
MFEMEENLIISEAQGIVKHAEHFVESNGDIQKADDHLELSIHKWQPE